MTKGNDAVKPVPGQDIFEKPPEGYREATLEEKEKILTTGMALELLGAMVAQHRAELDAATLRLKDVQQELQIAAAQRKELLEKVLGLEGKPEDMKSVGTRVYIKVAKPKKEEKKD